MWMLWWVYCTCALLRRIPNSSQEYSDNRHLRRVQVVAHPVERWLFAFLGRHRSFGGILRVVEIAREEGRSEDSCRGEGKS